MQSCHCLIEQQAVAPAYYVVWFASPYHQLRTVWIASAAMYHWLI